MTRFALIMLVAMSCGRSRESNDAGHDAGSCFVEDGTIVMTWASFCAQFPCDGREPATCSPAYQTTSGCGFRVYSWSNPEADGAWVYDDAGVLVGQRFSGDLIYACEAGPDDVSFRVKAGVFPGCAQTACACVDGGLECP